MKRYNLKFWRMRQGLTQSQVAEKLGISMGHYKGVENGRYNAPAKLIDKFCEAFAPDSQNEQEELRRLFK